jgi:hypothetical protein
MRGTDQPGPVREGLELPDTLVPFYSGHIGYTIEVFGGGFRTPWKECNAMDERLKFVARLLDGENAELSLSV